MYRIIRYTNTSLLAYSPSHRFKSEGRRIRGWFPSDSPVFGDKNRRFASSLSRNIFDRHIYCINLFDAQSCLTLGNFFEREPSYFGCRPLGPSCRVESACVRSASLDSPASTFTHWRERMWQWGYPLKVVFYLPTLERPIIVYYKFRYASVILEGKPRMKAPVAAR